MLYLSNGKYAQVLFVKIYIFKKNKYGNKQEILFYIFRALSSKSYFF
uniref:Uncharacterized protein n=1 Tax=viral metagenome TaxID=1070528 RepID=A0A6C0BXQ5_9ZZZZ